MYIFHSDKSPDLEKLSTQILFSVGSRLVTASNGQRVINILPQSRSHFADISHKVHTKKVKRI